MTNHPYRTKITPYTLIEGFLYVGTDNNNYAYFTKKYSTLYVDFLDGKPSYNESDFKKFNFDNIDLEDRLAIFIEGVSESNEAKKERAAKDMGFPCKYSRDRYFGTLWKESVNNIGYKNVKFGNDKEVNLSFLVTKEEQSKFDMLRSIGTQMYDLHVEVDDLRITRNHKSSNTRISSFHLHKCSNGFVYLSHLYGDDLILPATENQIESLKINGVYDLETSVCNMHPRNKSDTEDFETEPSYGDGPFVITDKQKDGNWYLVSGGPSNGNGGAEVVIARYYDGRWIPLYSKQDVGGYMGAQWWYPLPKVTKSSMEQATIYAPCKKKKEFAKILALGSGSKAMQGVLNGKVVSVTVNKSGELTEMKMFPAAKN